MPKNHETGPIQWARRAVDAGRVAVAGTVVLTYLHGVPVLAKPITPDDETGHSYHAPGTGLVTSGGSFPPSFYDNEFDEVTEIKIGSEKWKAIVRERYNIEEMSLNGELRYHIPEITFDDNPTFSERVYIATLIAQNRDRKIHPALFIALLSSEGWDYTSNDHLAQWYQNGYSRGQVIVAPDGSTGAGQHQRENLPQEQWERIKRSFSDNVDWTAEKLLLKDRLAHKNDPDNLGRVDSIDSWERAIQYYNYGAAPHYRQRIVALAHRIEANYHWPGYLEKKDIEEMISSVMCQYP